MSLQVQKREAHWMPLPEGCSAVVGAPAYQVDEMDKFSKGEIVSFFPRQQFGFVRLNNNEEAYFSLQALELVGENASVDRLCVGLRIGYDVAWTSKGVHVNRIKMY
ncbi:MAG: hypothetical protein COV43_08670 [Deltaproteobacteria bacterium CG11_big_fil_rev_8_21_14_0_20_42_23]|nr:MAG: hypothetical protein COV43_08670 [Deltaproteobacteria bacterium CG11_big_fil_rev_8_21_14_0_20_42_23]